MHDLTVETAVFKTVGEDQYLHADIPLKYYVYVRDKLKRARRVSFFLLSSKTLPREFGYEV